MKRIESELARLVISENQETPTLVILREKEGPRTLTIGIHIVEAIAINRKISGESFPRPMTHDLTLNLIGELGGTLRRITVNDLRVNEHKQGTYHALIEIEKEDGTVIEVDARPSDALALAVRAGCPIFVAEHVFAVESGE